MLATIPTEVKRSHLGGRGLFTTQTADPGSCLLSLDRPLLAVLDQSRIEDTCSQCFAWTELPVLSGAGINQVTKVHWCTGCKKVKYCSKSCQSQAWKLGHKRECKIFAAQPDVIPSVIVAAMRVLWGLSAGEGTYAALKDAEAHQEEFEKVGGKKWEFLQLMAHTAVKMMGDKDDLNRVELAKKVMCLLMCNSSKLVTPTFDPLGLALDPRSCVINHSCTPNAVVVFDGPKLSVRALETIKKGEEVFISYVDSAAPFGVRQAELQDQYFFTCACAKCKLGPNAPGESFDKPGPDFEEKIKVIDSMIPDIEQDPAWPRHRLGVSTREKRLSALQFYGYSYLDAAAGDSAQDVARLRKAITICRNSEVFPMTRAPLPQLHQQYAVACLGAKRYNEALIAMLRLYVLIDPTIYTQNHHPVRVVHAWTLATLAKAVGNDPDAPFCQALQQCGVDLSLLFLALLVGIHEQVAKSHGADSKFARLANVAFQEMFEPGGELDLQYGERGVKRPEWQRMLSQQIDELWPKINAFVSDEALASQIDEALVAA